MEISKDILEGCKRSDRRSQFRLYEACYPYMMSIALRYRNNADTAAGSVNIAFMKILSNLNTFDSGLSIKAWIRRIMINTLIDEYRKTKRADSIKINTDYEKDIAVNGILVDYNDAESNLNVEALTQYIHELNPLTGNVFNLYVMDGYSHKDIGNMLDISESASKWHLFTARKQLQEKVLKMQESSNQFIHSNIKTADYEK